MEKLDSADGVLKDLPTGVRGVSEGTVETTLVSGLHNVNIKHSSRSNIATNYDSNMMTTEQGVLTERQDLPTTVDSTESKLATVELVIGTWNIQSGRSACLETALQVLSIVGVDFCFLTKKKLTDGIYTRNFSGYQV